MAAPFLMSPGKKTFVVLTHCLPAFSSFLLAPVPVNLYTKYIKYTVFLYLYIYIYTYIHIYGLLAVPCNEENNSH